MEEQSVGHETLAQKLVRPFMVGLEKVRLTEATQKFAGVWGGGAGPIVAFLAPCAQRVVS